MLSLVRARERPTTLQGTIDRRQIFLSHYWRTHNLITSTLLFLGVQILCPPSVLTYSLDDNAVFVFMFQSSQKEVDNNYCATYTIFFKIKSLLKLIFYLGC